VNDGALESDELALKLVLGDVYAIVSVLPHWCCRTCSGRLTISLRESLAQSLDVPVIFALDYLTRSTQRTFDILVPWSLYLSLVSAALDLLLIFILLPLLVRFDLGLECFDLVILPSVGLLLLALLSDSLVEAEPGGEGANDGRDKGRNDEGFFEVLLLEAEC
jgi:hypothetical protein